MKRPRPGDQRFSSAGSLPGRAQRCCGLAYSGAG